MRGTLPGRLIALVMLLMVIGVGTAVLINARPASVSLTIIPPPPTRTPVPLPTPAPISVYVSGAINGQAVVVSLPFRSRVQDALDTAGGAAPNADLSRINLAGPLRDGDQIYVPALGETPPPLATQSIVLVRINSASAEELDALPGVGPALAQAIIVYREANGRFSSLEDVDNVDGIGAATLAAIAEYLVFD